MRISIETSKPHLVKELFNRMTKKHEILAKCQIEMEEEHKEIDSSSDQEAEEPEKKFQDSDNFLCDKEPSFVELLNYMRILWSTNNNVYVNVLYNIVVYPQFMVSKEKCTQKEYSIYKSIFNRKNYMPDIVILLYDENTVSMENMLNDPFFKIHVFKVQLLDEMLNETAQMLSDTLMFIYGNYIDDSSQFSYFEQCYANYNCIDKKK
jgi:hypothetical protein